MSSSVLKARFWSWKSHGHTSICWSTFTLAVKRNYQGGPPNCKETPYCFLRLHFCYFKYQSHEGSAASRPRDTFVIKLQRCDWSFFFTTLFWRSVPYPLLAKDQVEQLLYPWSRNKYYGKWCAVSSVWSAWPNRDHKAATDFRTVHAPTRIEQL